MLKERKASYHIWLKNTPALEPEQIKAMVWSVMNTLLIDIDYEVQEDCHLVRVLTGTTVERATLVALTILALHWFLTEVRMIPWYERVVYCIFESTHEKPMEFLHPPREGDDDV